MLFYLVLFLSAVTYAAEIYFINIEYYKVHYHGQAKKAPYYKITFEYYLEARIYLLYIPHVVLALWLKIWHSEYFKGQLSSLVIIQFLLIANIPTGIHAF